MTWSHNLRCFLAQMLLVLPPSRVVFFSSTCVSRANNSTRKGNSRSKQKRALRTRVLFFCWKRKSERTRRRRKKERGSWTTGEFFFTPDPSQKFSFVRARVHFFLGSFFFSFFGKKTRRFFCISEPYSCIGRKKKKKRVLLARFELAISRLLSGRLNHLATKARLIILD